MWCSLLGDLKDNKHLWERVIILQSRIFGMEVEKRKMPICFTSDQLKMIEEYAKRKGMLNASQAIEDLIARK
jgi:hypothetical protein